ncbi:MAG: N-acetylmuramoyl-L-alanine amidase [Elusimicrobia bacterium]|nr:N-acetylmuramoyl-L-alanine amidase [Elusimicrobiota bacterium]
MKCVFAAALLLTLAHSAAARPEHKVRIKPAVEPPVEISFPGFPPGWIRAERSTEPIIFVWPTENLTIAAQATFIIGNVIDPKAAFTINGETVTVHKDGGFNAYLPISPGTFTFRAELALATGTAVAERRILVPLPPSALPTDKLYIDPASPTPRTNLELRAGDWLSARLRATPGRRARWRIGRQPWREMREGGPGNYEDAWQAPPGLAFAPAAVEYELSKGWSSVGAKAPATVAVLDSTPPIATARSTPAGFINMRTGPNNGFLLFPFPGTRLPVTGRDGASVRVQVSQNLVGWLAAKDVDLSTGTAPPRAVTGNVGVVRSDRGAVLKIGLSERAVVDAQPDDDMGGLTIRLHSTVLHTNWARNEAPEVVSEVRWRHESTDVVVFHVRLAPGIKLWGWTPSYEGSSLKIDIRRPPSIDPLRPLKGIRVMLDPGHMPSLPGATGPLWTREMDANYAIMLALKRRLERSGAVVLPTRDSPTHELSLTDRPVLAVERGADLFVSLHNNAIPDGENPYAKPHGFMVFYYHPQSLDLAREVQAAFTASIPLPDEGMKWADLLVTRLTAMPSILIENTFINSPEQEQMLNDPYFRESLARAAATGIERFLVGAARRSR